MLRTPKKGRALFTAFACLGLSVLGCGTTSDSMDRRLAGGSLIPFSNSDQLDHRELKKTVEQDPFPSADSVGLAVAED